MEVKYNIRYLMEDNEFDFIELKLSSNSLNKKEIQVLKENGIEHKYLEIFKNIYFEEVELDTFYSYVLSKKENQDKKVLVGYNGIDGKEITMSKFKEDINEIRDSRSTLKKS